MENFIAYNPVKVHFGKGVVSDLSSAVHEYGNSVLLVYGKGSVKMNGIYDQVIDNLKKSSISVYEYEGIKSNPLISDVRNATKLGIEKNIEVVVALGGGSVIDSSKIISAAIANKSDGWDIMKNKVTLTFTIPVISILTLAATGSEMNSVAVIQNPDTEEKIGYGHPLLFPRHSFLDPDFTASVPANYTAYGVVDLVAHCLEAYFGFGEATLSDRFVEAIIKEAMEYGPQLRDHLSDYDLRAKIMWAATNALNNITVYGRSSGDWGVHAIGHTLSFLFDTPHGASLSIAYPAWLKLQTSRIPHRISQLGMQLFQDPSIDHTIEKLENFFSSLNSPLKLKDIGINSDKHQRIVDLMKKNKITGANNKLGEADYEKLVVLMS
jgi:alcohol dehydrogenase YqhD (iron-dependent ADH family)